MQFRSPPPLPKSWRENKGSPSSQLLVSHAPVFVRAQFASESCSRGVGISPVKDGVLRFSGALSSENEDRELAFEVCGHEEVVGLGVEGHRFGTRVGGDSLNQGEVIISVFVVDRNCSAAVGHEDEAVRRIEGRGVDAFADWGGRYDFPGVCVEDDHELAASATGEEAA